ncbi:MAG: hypothetical protein H0W88_00485 [Parachlamydiaceae bacterium]|nr:hypothetical protein [Parachlamydiaceae bacterium]
MNASILPENKPPATSSSPEKTSGDSAETTKTSMTSIADKIPSLTTPETSENQTPRKVKIIKKELKLEKVIASLNEKILNLKQEVTNLKKEQEPTLGKRLKGLVAWTLGRAVTESSDKTIKSTIQLKEVELAKAESELSKTTAKLAKLQKKLGFDEAEWIKFVLKHLKDKPKVDIEPKYKISLLSKVVNIGLKSTLKTELQTTHRIYQSAWGYDLSFVKLTALQNLIKKSLVTGKPLFGMKTPEEQRGLKRLLQHRLNILEFQKLYYDCLQNKDNPETLKQKNLLVVNKIFSEVNNLKLNTQSENILLLEDGSSMLTMPGGWGGHFISYGIKKNVDGSFEFLVFNRGQKSSKEDVNGYFHGSVTFNDKGKTVSKSTVSIKVPFIALLDTGFLNTLVTSFHHGDRNSIYSALNKFLLHDYDGNARRTDMELMLHYLQYVQSLFNIPPSQNDVIDNFLRDAIRSDPDSSPLYHAEQQFGTCGDSNSTPVENMLAPKTTNLVVFQDTLASLVDEVRENYLGPKPKMETNNQKEAFQIIETVLQKDKNKLLKLLEIYKKTYKNKGSKWLTRLQDVEKHINMLLVIVNNLKENFENRNLEVDKLNKFNSSQGAEKKKSLDAIELLEKNCVEGLKKLLEFAPTNLTSTVKELTYHFIKAFGHEKQIQVFASKKLVEVQQKLEAPPPIKKAKVTKEDVQKMIEQTIISDCADIDQNLSIDEFIKPFIDKLRNLNKCIEGEVKPEYQITLNAIKNICPIDIERIRKKLSPKQNQEIDDLLVEYQKQYELLKTSLDKETPPLDKKVYEYEIQQFDIKYLQQAFTIEQPKAFIAIWKYKQIMSKIK